MLRLLKPFLATSLAALLGVGAIAAEKSSPVSKLREALHAETLGVGTLQRADVGDSPLVQAYLGKVQLGKTWFSVDDAIAQLAQESKVAEYRERQAKVRDDALDHIKLADWCKLKGLHDEERAHLLRAIDFDPDNASVRRRLGHVRGERQWMSREEAEENRRQDKALAAAKEQWLPTLKSLKRLMDASVSSQREEFREQFAAIRDPLAIGALEEVLSSDQDALLLVEILSGIDDPRAAQALVRLAANSEHKKARAAAITGLQQLDLYNSVPLLLAAMRGDITSNVTLVPSPGGMVYSQNLVRQAQDYDEKMIMNVNIRRFGTNAAANRLLTEVVQVRAQEENDRLARNVREENEKIAARNKRIMEALGGITGANPGSTAQAWWDWWRQQHEVSEQRIRGSVTWHHTSAVGLSDQAPLADPQVIPNTFSSDTDFQSERVQQRHECFVAGTPVWTARGKVAIEQIRTGERVLTQNLQTGALEFKPVIRPTTRPAMQLVRVTIGNETFDCTGGHLFWVVEQGWVKARDLKAGMVVHAAGGVATVVDNESGSYKQTHNLVLADNHNYFVGASRLLTHDNTPRKATTLVAPGVMAEE